jgi:FkbM family methyltransferase
MTSSPGNRTPERPVHVPSSGFAPRHTLPGWQRIARRAVLSLAKRSLSSSVRRLAAKVPPLGDVADRFLRRVEGIEVEVCGAPFRLDVLRRSVSRSVYLGGRWHSPVVEMIRAHVRPGMTAVDVGANVGFMAVHMGDRAGPDGEVLAFEPEPRNFAVLARNARVARFRNVVPIQAAIGDAAGTARLYLSTRDGGDHRIVPGPSARPSIDVPLTTIDRVAEERGATVHFVKMDIQGAEGAALRGMERTLASKDLRGLVIEFWPAALEAAGDPPVDVLARIRAGGLRCANLPEADRDPAAFVAAIPEGGSRDLLYLRP